LLNYKFSKQGKLNLKLIEDKTKVTKQLTLKWILAMQIAKGKDDLTGVSNCVQNAFRNEADYGSISAWSCVWLYLCSS
jgi:hypothetical protein